MYNNFYPYQNMYAQQYGQTAASFNPMQQNNVMEPRSEIVRVNGKNGAQAYKLPPNSSILLLDESAPIIWFKKTDGAGYPELVPYDILPHQSQSEIFQQTLEQRISKLEDIVNELTQSNSESSQPVKRVAVAKESKSN